MAWLVRKNYLGRKKHNRRFAVIGIIVGTLVGVVLLTLLVNAVLSDISSKIDEAGGLHGIAVTIGKELKQIEKEINEEE